MVILRTIGDDAVPLVSPVGEGSIAVTLVHRMLHE
jgi:hypothetical protein